MAVHSSGDFKSTTTASLLSTSHHTGSDEKSVENKKNNLFECGSYNIHMATMPNKKSMVTLPSIHALVNSRWCYGYYVRDASSEKDVMGHIQFDDCKLRIHIRDVGGIDVGHAERTWPLLAGESSVDTKCCVVVHARPGSSFCMERVLQEKTKTTHNKDKKTKITKKTVTTKIKELTHVKLRMQTAIESEMWRTALHVFLRDHGHVVTRMKETRLPPLNETRIAHVSDTIVSPSAANTSCSTSNSYTYPCKWNCIPIGHTLNDHKNNNNNKKEQALYESLSPTNYWALNLSVLSLSVNSQLCYYENGIFTNDRRDTPVFQIDSAVASIELCTHKEEGYDDKKYSIIVYRKNCIGRIVPYTVTTILRAHRNALLESLETHLRDKIGYVLQYCDRNDGRCSTISTKIKVHKSVGTSKTTNKKFCTSFMILKFLVLVFILVYANFPFVTINISVTTTDSTTTPTTTTTDLSRSTTTTIKETNPTSLVVEITTNTANVMIPPVYYTNIYAYRLSLDSVASKSRVTFPSTVATENKCLLYDTLISNSTPTGYFIRNNEWTNSSENITRYDTLHLPHVLHLQVVDEPTHFIQDNHVLIISTSHRNTQLKNTNVIHTDFHTNVSQLLVLVSKHTYFCTLYHGLTKYAANAASMGDHRIYLGVQTLVYHGKFHHRNFAFDKLSELRTILRNFCFPIHHLVLECKSLSPHNNHAYYAHGNATLIMYATVCNNEQDTWNSINDHATEVSKQMNVLCKARRSNTIDLAFYHPT